MIGFGPDTDAIKAIGFDTYRLYRGSVEIRGAGGAIEQVQRCQAAMKNCRVHCGAGTTISAIPPDAILAILAVSPRTIQAIFKATTFE